VVAGPDPECPFCPRLVDFRAANRAAFPDWHNGPVPSFGGAEARLLIVGLAPGLRGANRTGRPFTGDAAGKLLYPTLLHFGFARGTYDERPVDGLELIGCRVTNAVRCVPPENRPIGAEVAACRPFLGAEIESLANLQAIVALGTVAHNAVLDALGLRRRDHAFAHGARHPLDGGLLLADSYHCSRYNLNTGRLTEAMFDAVFVAVRRHLEAAGPASGAQP
jgi:uracil-DNA glycosylase family 4